MKRTKQQLFDDMRKAWDKYGWTYGGYRTGEGVCGIGALMILENPTDLYKAWAKILKELRAAGIDEVKLILANDACRTREQAEKKIMKFLGLKVTK